MRWITFAILLYLMTALESAHLGALPSANPMREPWPEVLFVPMLAVFYALYAAETAAPLAALVCGLMLDITDPSFLGTNAVPLAIVAWLIVRIRLSIFREHMISQVVMTLLAVLAFAFLAALFRKLIGAPLHGGGFWRQFGNLAGDAVYTAILAPLFFWFFFRFRQLLGFSSHGPRIRGHG